jgi:drug/metabolite transporter (DMT)-like permease
MTLTPRLFLLLSLPPLLWAGNAVLGRMLVGLVPPMTLNLLRWVFAVAILLPLAWRALRPWSRIRERWGYLFAIGVLGAGTYNSLQYLALVSSTPINVTLVASSLPVWSLVVGMAFFGERPARQQLLGAALGMGAVVLVLSRGSWDLLLGVRFVPGDLCMVLAVIGWSFYSWLLARPPAHMRGERRPDWNWAGFLLIQALFGLIGSGVFSATEQALGTHPVAWSLPVLAALLYTALGASILAYRCWGLGVAEGGPMLASLFNNLTPPMAALLSGALLGEAPKAYHGLAFLLLLAGIWVSSRRTTAPS